MGRRNWNFVVGSALMMGAVLLTDAPEASACGGFFCNGTPTGPTPVVQAGERVMFEEMDDGRVRAYVQIRYDQGAPIGFSWVVPVMSVPELGIADAATFDQLDFATSPQFRFINAAGGTGGAGGGVGCAASDGRFADSPTSGGPGMEFDDGVRVWDDGRVGDYQTAVIEGRTGDDVRAWLVRNDYDIPAAADEIIDHYVYTGHVFAAFRYDPIDGVGGGSLPPVTITYDGGKPCVPIKITAIASTPILDVMVLAFGEGRARPDGEYTEIRPNYDAIRTDFTTPTQTTYTDEVDAAIEEAGHYAWVVEHASPTDMVQGVTDTEAQAMLSRNGYVTRFYTRFTPDRMEIDPEFSFTDERADVNRLHVIDTRNVTASSSAALSEDTRFAVPPILPAVFGAVGVALVWRRRRR